MAKRNPPPRERQPAGSKPRPVCKAILLCDQVIQDALTGKPSLIGIIDDFYLAQVPGRTQPVTAYLQLTQGVGRYALTVEVHDLQADKVIARAQNAEVTFEDRLEKHDIVIPVPPLPVEHAGLYDFVVLADGKEVDRQQFRVVIPQQEDRDEAQEPEDPAPT